MLKRTLNIVIICLCATTSFSQTEKQLTDFSDARKQKDHGLSYYLKFLDTGDSTDFFFQGWRNDACEIVANIYESKKDYPKAIAYYDSAETKYRNDFIHCGNAAFGLQLPRKYRISRCYLAMNEPKKALSTLTPVVFDGLATMPEKSIINYYVDLLQLFYTKEQIKKELTDGINNMKYSYHFEPGPDSTTRLLYVSCILSVFGEQLEQAGNFTYVKSDEEAKEKLSWRTKESFIWYIKEQLAVYKKIQEL